MLEEITWFIIKFINKLKSYGDGIDILEESWDNIIILDDCRYDFFKEIFTKRKMKGELEFRMSKGTDTPSFLLGNFENYSKLNNIVYVTANPFVDKLLKQKVYKIVSVWKYCWDERRQTVPPEAVYKYALIVAKKYYYSDKRIIIHFLQPHSPYPNGTGETKPRDGMHAIISEIKFNPKYKLDDDYYVHWPYIGPKPLMVDKLKLGYMLNLKLVIPYVEKLIDILPGKTVVTSDHGEAFGEKIHPFIPIRVYGHPQGIRIPVLVKVPWLVVEPDEKEPKSIKDLEKELARIRSINRQKFKVNEKQKLKAKIKELKLKKKI